MEVLFGKLAFFCKCEEVLCGQFVFFSTFFRVGVYGRDGVGVVANVFVASGRFFMYGTKRWPGSEIVPATLLMILKGRIEDATLYLASPGLSCSRF